MSAATVESTNRAFGTQVTASCATSPRDRVKHEVDIEKRSATKRSSVCKMCQGCVRLGATLKPRLGRGPMVE
jgi:hypothetical protein